MQFNIIPPNQFRSVAWKNGQGITQELAFGGTSIDSFDWRLSMAPVIMDGDFSDFGQYDRTLVLIDGNGLTLNHSSGQQDTLNQRFDMAHFDGGWRTNAKLHDGDILDFNVMTRQSKCRSKVTTSDDSIDKHLSPGASLLLIYAVDSEITIIEPNSNAITLLGKHLFQTEVAKPGRWLITGGPLVFVEIDHD